MDIHRNNSGIYIIKIYQNYRRIIKPSCCRALSFVIVHKPTAASLDLCDVHIPVDLAIQLPSRDNTGEM